MSAMTPSAAHQFSFQAMLLAIPEPPYVWFRNPQARDDIELTIVRQLRTQIRLRWFFVGRVSRIVWHEGQEISRAASAGDQVSEVNRAPCSADTLLSSSSRPEATA